MRFQKKNHIIHIQIQESPLLPKGEIDELNTKWKPIDNYTVYDQDVFDMIDYHTMLWAKRAIDLDDLTPNTDLQLLTGKKNLLLLKYSSNENIFRCFSYLISSLIT